MYTILIKRLSLVIAFILFLIPMHTFAAGGDLNSDRKVDVTDLGILLSNWGSSDSADINNDGVVDVVDLGILLSNWGSGTVAPPGAKFQIGERVETTGKVKVRDIPSKVSGIVLEEKSINNFGTVIDGPLIAESRTWYNVNFDTDPDGWLGEQWLQLSALPPPTYSQGSYAPPPVTLSTVGITTVGTSQTTAANLRAMPYVMKEDGTLNNIRMYHNGGSGMMKLGVYTGASAPTTLVGETSSTAISGSTGWQSISLKSPVPIQKGTTIWLAWLYGTNPGIYYINGSPGRYDRSDTWTSLGGNLPNPFGSGSQANILYSIYAEYTPGVVVAPPPPTYSQGSYAPPPPQTQGTFLIYSNDFESGFGDTQFQWKCRSDQFTIVNTPPAREGSFSLKTNQPGSRCCQEPSVNECKHRTLVRYAKQTDLRLSSGIPYWIGFSMQFPKGLGNESFFAFTITENISGSNPDLFINGGDTIELRRKWNDGIQHTVTEAKVPIIFDRWMDVVMKYVRSSSPGVSTDGSWKVWVDGDLKVDVSGVKIGAKGSIEPYIRTGIYWGQEQRSGNYTVYYDNIKVAEGPNGYELVSPSNF